MLVLMFLSVLLWFVKIKFVQWFGNLWWNLFFLCYLFCVMWSIFHGLSNLCKLGECEIWFLNFDDKHNIVWSLMLFSISFPYWQCCGSCCNRLMYCSTDSFSSCLAAPNIDLSILIYLFFLMQKCWSSASNDVLYSAPSHSSTFSVSYMSCVSWPTICSNKAF